MVLTEKEMATIEDLHTQELSCVEKYKRYGQEAKDPVLRDLFADLEKKEQKHVESLEQVMKGSVPSCNVNDRDGKMYEPKATYDSMTNPEDKKNDNFLATDSIGSEKWCPERIIPMCLHSEIPMCANFWQISRWKNKTTRRCSINIKP